MIDSNRLEEIMNSVDVSEYIPELLAGIQDINWPNAERVVSLLRPMHNEVLPHIKEILKTDDYVWIYWILDQLVNYWPTEFVMEIKDELTIMSHKIDIEEELDILSTRILLKNKLCDLEQIKETIKNKNIIMMNDIGEFTEDQLSVFNKLEEERIRIIFSNPSLIMKFISENSEILKKKNKYELIRDYCKSLEELKDHVEDSQ